MNFKNKVKKDWLYAVTAGDHLGKFVLFIHPEKKQEFYDVLLIGQGRAVSSNGFERTTIPKKDVHAGIKNKIIEKVDIPPNDVYNILYQEWIALGMKQ